MPRSRAGRPILGSVGAFPAYHEQLDRACILREVVQGVAVDGDRLACPGRGSVSSTSSGGQAGPSPAACVGGRVVVMNVVYRDCHVVTTRSAARESRLIERASEPRRWLATGRSRRRPSPSLRRVMAADDGDRAMRCGGQRRCGRPDRVAAAVSDPMEPRQSIAAASVRVPAAQRVGSCKISISILTGLSVDSTTMKACLQRFPRLPDDVARILGIGAGHASGSMADTRRSGISRLAASSTAHSAASSADREPSIPTTTVRGRGLA